MITSILSERQEEIRSSLAEVLIELRGVLERLGDGSDWERVDRGLGDLDTMFRIGLAGGAGADVEGLAAFLVPGPVDRLSVVVGAPGEAADWGESGVDLALFLTSASRPLPPAERPLLVAASEGAAGVFVVVDGVEMLRLADDVTRMEEAVALSAERVLGRPPHAAGVATALAAGATETGPAPSESLLPALASRVVGVLRAPAVVRPKLRAPLDLAREVAAERRAGAEAGLAALADDLENLEVLEGELGRFEYAAEAALRQATAEVEEAVDAYGERARAFVRGRTRPFLPSLNRRRLEERFEQDAVRGLPERLREAASGLEERLRRAAADGRAAVVERLDSFPTGRSRRHPPPASGEAGGAALSDAAPEPVERALEELRPDPSGGRLLPGLLRASALSFGLLLLGIVVAVTSFLGAPGLGPADGGALLGGGLGGAAVLAAVSLLRFRRRRLAAELDRDLDRLRAGAAAALAAAAEGAAAGGREAIREPVGAYAAAVAEERDRLTEARGALDRLLGELEDLAGRIDRA